MKQTFNIVWLKRDLRLQDHEPLQLAELAKEDYLIVYFFEPSIIEYPDTSDRHLKFIYHSIKELNIGLYPFSRSVHLFYEEADEIFQYLCKQFNISKVFSYQESGIRLTWERDKQVAELLRQQKVKWIECQRDGVIRGINNRNGWDKRWRDQMSNPIIENNYSQSLLDPIHNPFPLSKGIEKRLQVYPDRFQRPGESFAWKYLNSFCEGRGKNYNKYISKPLESRKSCGRISPFLAWGNISIRQAFQFVITHPNFTKNKRSFSGLLTRLNWHCHFIQKFESECDYETRCVNRGYETLTYTNNHSLIKAWKTGQTGLPLVDACMRCLIETGWINFRMRAMLVSVFCHHFDCNWKKGVYHLANLFLDYEPGIHYPQFQMQAGTTGVNTIRMYNPIKQSKDHDPKGVFIKKWIPELREIPLEFIHEPWTMTEMERAFLGVRISYPKPVINVEENGRTARDKIWGHRKTIEVQIENQRIVQQHTRNPNSRK